VCFYCDHNEGTEEEETILTKFQSGLYLRGWDRLENELQFHMGGEVRNFVASL